MLSTLITSKSRIEVLTWFVSHSDERFHYLQLDKLLSASRPSLQKELKRLEDGGVLRSVKEGNMRFYWINRDYPLYPELKSIIFKTAGLADFLKESLTEIGDVKAAFIYGSVAKNVENMGSDIDLMLIGDIDMDALHEALDAAEQRIGREINPTVYNWKEWSDRIKIGNAFVTDVLKGKKIFLVGDEDGLEAAD
ncbi:MAG: nucleotidyltransferase domain-containing protein [Coriobacteriia bacterium]